jgi:hypothetical protein
MFAPQCRSSWLMRLVTACAVAAVRVVIGLILPTAVPHLAPLAAGSDGWAPAPLQPREAIA